MKIALPIEGTMLNQHFGRSKSFAIVTVDGKTITGTEEISSSELQHNHQGLADLLKKSGVDVVIVGGIGAGAVKGIQDNNLGLVRGAKGIYVEVVNQYLNGTLVSNEEVCDHHGEGHHHHH